MWEMSVKFKSFVEVLRMRHLCVSISKSLSNLLNSKPERGYEDIYEEFKLSKFSMIVFDEAHHANDQHPYNGIYCMALRALCIFDIFIVIMQSYHSLSQSIDFKNDTQQRLPQIVALTASLGIGNSSTTLEEAIKHAQIMCANLAVDAISRVRCNVQEMKNYTSEVSDEIILVEADDFKNLEFYKALVKELDFLEEEVLSIPEAKTDAVLCQALKDKNNSSHLQQSYEQWICNCQRNIVPRYPSMLQESRNKLMHCFDHLLIFYHAIELLRHFGSDTALSFIEEKRKTFLVSKSTQATSHLRAILRHLKQQPKSVSSMFKALLNILDRQFLERLDARVLIFALTRFQCKCLAELIRENTSFSADFLTGSRASLEENGSNASSQKKKVADFNEGKTKILCVTSVAEEGLDISACSLVVQYNSITNEIAHVQRRGRSRAKKAKSVILTFDSRVKSRAELNRLREKLMVDALEEIDRKSTYYMGQIPEIAQSLRQKWLLTNNLVAPINRNSNRVNAQQRFAVQRNFGSCGAFLCYSDRIVLHGGGQHVCVDPDYLNRVTLSLSSNRTIGDRDVVMNPANFRHCCANRLPSGVCGADLGPLASHVVGVSLPILSCKSIVFLGVSQNHTSKVIDDSTLSRYSFKVWKDAKKIFEPTPLSTLDLLEMKSANAFEKLLREFSMMNVV